MAIYPQDIDEKILLAIGQIFQTELINNFPNDPLMLRTLKEAPLQDDPTLTAPYVIYDNEEGQQGQSMRLVAHGHEEAEYGMAEIGGPIRYLYCYGSFFGTPLATTRNQARADGAALMTRIVRTLIKYSSLSGVLVPGQDMASDDDGQRIEGQNNRLVTRAGYYIFGGETTFYGKGSVYWHYPVSWYP